VYKRANLTFNLQNVFVSVTSLEPMSGAGARLCVYEHFLLEGHSFGMIDILQQRTLGLSGSRDSDLVQPIVTEI